jgi:Bacterial regulatory protein, arsR family
MASSLQVSSSLISRRKELGASIWVWLWLVNNTTAIAPLADGTIQGFACGGKKLDVAQIANDLNLSTADVLEQIEVLSKAGLVTKKGGSR